MKAFFLIIIAILFITACQQPKKRAVVKTPATDSQPAPVKSIDAQQTDAQQSRVSADVSRWFDSLVVVYNANTSNPLVRATIADKKLKEEWLFDRELNTDTANYYVYHVGHDVADTDGQRFVTDSWIYVDTLKRKFFESTPDGKLVDWKPVKPE